VACAASLETPAPFTVAYRRAEAEGDIVVEDFPAANLAAGETHFWEGTAVATSDVVLEVQIEAGESTLTVRNDPSAHFEVEPRSWPTWFLTFPPTLTVEVDPGQNMVDPPRLNMTWGFMSVVLPTPGQLSNAIARVNSGPNAGIAYLAQPVHLSDYEVNLHPALVQPSHPWYADQNGEGAGTCVESDVLTFSANIGRHEGSIPGSTSHVTVSNDVFSGLNPQQVLERTYTPEDDGQLAALIRNYLRFFFGPGGAFMSAQRAFDSTYAALGLVFNGIDCEFDFDPLDQ